MTIFTLYIENWKIKIKIKINSYYWTFLSRNWMHNVSDVHTFSTWNTSYIQQTLYKLCTFRTCSVTYYICMSYILLGTTSAYMCVCTLLVVWGWWNSNSILTMTKLWSWISSRILTMNNYYFARVCRLT